MASAVIQTAEAEWRVDDATDECMFFHPRVNTACSWLGCLLFALIVHSCVKRCVYSKRKHDVLLILLFAFLSDLFEMRMHLFFIFNMHQRSRDFWDPLPTTVAACTLGVWIFYLHFLNSYVEAAVTIYRFITQTMGKSLSVCYVYAGIASALSLHALLLFETFLHGAPESPVFPHVAWPISCTRAYTLGVPALISQLTTAATIAIAPILSGIMLLKRSKTKACDSGVTTFIFLSSISMVYLVYIFLWGRYGAPGKYMPQQVGYIVTYIFIAAYTVQYSRLLLLCIAAISVVGDIRGAVCSVVMEFLRKILDRKSTLPSTITNVNYHDSD